MSTYRVGNYQPQNVYRGEQYIGVMFTAEDAALAVEALNGTATKAEPPECGCPAGYRRTLVVNHTRECSDRQGVEGLLASYDFSERADSCTCRVPASKCDGYCSGNWVDPDCSWHGRPVRPDPACPVHQGRRARGPKPPPVGPGCICDGSGRTCPRHGAVL